VQDGARRELGVPGWYSQPGLKPFVLFSLRFRGSFRGLKAPAPSDFAAPGSELRSPVSESGLFGLAQGLRFDGRLFPPALGDGEDAIRMQSQDVALRAPASTPQTKTCLWGPRASTPQTKTCLWGPRAWAIFFDPYGVECVAVCRIEPKHRSSALKCAGLGPARGANAM